MVLEVAFVGALRGHLQIREIAATTKNAPGRGLVVGLDDLVSSVSQWNVTRDFVRAETIRVHRHRGAASLH